MRRLAGLGGILLLAAIGTARAQSISLTAHLFGSGMVPKTKSDAFGEAQFTYDSQTRQLDYYVTYDGAAPTRIDIHGPAGPGESAGAITSLPVSEQPITGKTALTGEQADALLAGRTYVDLHSAAYPDGEIRGQIGRQ